MALSPKLEQLVQLTTVHFELVNRNKFLSRTDKKHLKLFFVERFLDTRTRGGGGIVKNRQSCAANTDDFMTAREVEAWLRIDVKTLYHYVNQNLIPHLRVQSNVRFNRADLQRWIQRHSHAPSPKRAKPRSRAASTSAK